MRSATKWSLVLSLVSENTWQVPLGARNTRMIYQPLFGSSLTNSQGTECWRLASFLIGKNKLSLQPAAPSLHISNTALQPPFHHTLLARFSHSLKNISTSNPPSRAFIIESAASYASES